MDAPAFTRGKEKEEVERTAVEQSDRPLGDEEQKFQIVKITRRRKRKRRRGGKASGNESKVQMKKALFCLLFREPPPIQPLNPSIQSNSILTSVLTKTLTLILLCYNNQFF
jgi:hypothetical protein